MLYYLINHHNFILLFSVVPLCGMLIDNACPKRLIRYSIYIAGFFLLPIFSGYSYTIDNLYGVTVFIIAILGYALFINGVATKRKTVFYNTLTVVPICLIVSFAGVMFGIITVEREWEYKNYKIAYLTERGFSGGPLMTYELSEYALNRIFIKQIDTAVDNDTTGSCWVKFADTKFNFNKCNRELSFIEKK